MIPLGSIRIVSLIMVLIGAMTTGCGTTAPYRFYMLAPIHEPAPAGFAGAATRPLIGIRSVTWPDYLDRPQIATRVSQHRLVYDDSRRWAEPLQENFLRVLAENLAWRLKTDQVVQYPWPGGRRVGYQVVVRVLEFEAGPDPSAKLIALWSVRDMDHAEVVPTRRSSFSVAAPLADFDARARALSEAVASLSGEMAEALRHLGGRAMTSRAGTTDPVPRP